MESKPLFSIVIPSYNYGHFLKECVQSVIEQKFTRWECLIIDDGSTDQTSQIAAELAASDNRIQYHFQQNSGLSSARNKGISLSKGDYIQFLDADDLLQSNKLAHFARYMEAEPESDLFYAEGRLFLEDNKEQFFVNYLDLDQQPWTLDISGSGNTIIKEFLKFNRFLVNMPIVKTELAKKLWFDEQHTSVSDWKLMEKAINKEGYKFIQGNDDWDFWMRAAISGARFRKIPTEPETYSLLRLHGGSMSTKQQAMLSSQMMMRKRWDKAFKDEEIKQANLRLLKLNKLVYGINLKREGFDRTGRAFIASSLAEGKEIKYTLFGLLAYILPGEIALNLLKKVTGQI